MEEYRPPAGVKFSSNPGQPQSESSQVLMQKLARTFLFGHESPQKHVKGHANGEVNDKTKINTWRMNRNAVPCYGRQNRHEQSKIDHVSEEYGRQRSLEVRKRHAYLF